MPPRLRLPSTRTLQAATSRTPYICQQCRHASLATAAAIEPPPPMAAPIAQHPANQPPSYKRPEFRKTQLHRQYQSLLRSTPVMLLFQHNNLKATEWMGIRRELAIALQRADAELASTTNNSPLADQVKLHTLQTGIFASALKIVEFWHPSSQQPQEKQETHTHTHGLSHTAYLRAKNARVQTGLEPLLSGPLAVLALPAVSPLHLKTALSILSPDKKFPAPKRRVAPGYFEPAVQNGVQKLLLLGARVEGRVFDVDGARWVGGIEGGLDGLRGQLVAMLQGFGAGLSTTLEAASRSLYLTVEGRRGMLEEEEKGGAAKEGEASG